MHNNAYSIFSTNMLTQLLKWKIGVFCQPCNCQMNHGSKKYYDWLLYNTKAEGRNGSKWFLEVFKKNKSRAPTVNERIRPMMAAAPFIEESRRSSATSLCEVFCVADASSPPVALWHQKALVDYWLHHQLQQARRFWHNQLRHSIKIRICPAHQDQLTRRDPWVGSSQPSPVHSKVADALGRVVPLQGGIQAREVGGGFWRGTSPTQPHHVIDAQTLNQLGRKLHTGCIHELVEREGLRF